MPLIEKTIYLAVFTGIYFSIFIFLTFFENRRTLYKKPSPSFRPRVSLIVPCYNEESTIEKTLLSLINLDYPKDKLEIIVVDDGSRDQTLSKAKAFIKNHPDYNIKVFHKENEGKHSALNLGLERATSPFIGSVDADSFVHPQALSRMMTYFKDKDIKAVISTVKIVQANNIIEGIQKVEYLMGAFLRKVFSILDSVNVTPGPLSVFRREVFEKLGGYRKAHQTEDLEFAFRLQKANLRIAHALDAIVYTVACPNFYSLWRQRLRWRRGFLLNLRDYPELLNIKKHGNLAFVIYYNLAGSFLSIISVFYAVWRLASLILQKLNHLLVAGMNLSASSISSSFRLDVFLFNTNPLFFLGLLSTSILILFIIYSKKTTLEKSSIKKPAFFYFLFYMFLNVFWWLGAVGAILLRGKKDILWK